MGQAHAWQATFDANAKGTVGTTQPLLPGQNTV